MFVRDSFAFTEKIAEQDSELSKVSLDLDFLFANIPLEEYIEMVDQKFIGNRV